MPCLMKRLTAGAAVKEAKFNQWELRYTQPGSAADMDVRVCCAIRDDGSPDESSWWRPPRSASHLLEDHFS